MNDIIIAHLEKDYKNVAISKNKNFRSLIPVKKTTTTTTAKTNK
jgi:hypothetical protein